MTGLRLLLVVMLAVVVVYTNIVGFHYGWNLMPVFLTDLQAMAWPGQFDLDFMCFLALSGLWTAWRHHFSPLGLALGVVAFFGGTVFLATYLIIAIGPAQGDWAVLLLGPQRAAAR
jgi:hypothetical protein